VTEAETLNVQPGELVLWADDDAVYFGLRTMNLDGCSTIAVRHERRQVEGVVYALTQWLRT
jgi:hypothetical protein